MATAAVAKPPQALRRQRPSLSTKHTLRGGTTDATDDDTNKKLSEPYVKTTDFILRKFRGKQPSLVVHLHQTHFRFDQQEGSFPYDGPMRMFIEHLRSQTVPHMMVEEFLKHGVQFYDGMNQPG